MKTKKNLKLQEAQEGPSKTEAGQPQAPAPARGSTWLADALTDVGGDLGDIAAAVLMKAPESAAGAVMRARTNLARAEALEAQQTDGLRAAMKRIKDRQESAAADADHKRAWAYEDAYLLLLDALDARRGDV